MTHNNNNKTRIAIMALAAVTAMAFSSGTFAQDARLCAKRAELTADLAKRFNEEPIGMGLVSNGMLMELFSSADGKTWTVMISQPNGQSCLLGAGEGWEEIKPVPKGEGT